VSHILLTYADENHMLEEVTKKTIPNYYQLPQNNSTL